MNIIPSSALAPTIQRYLTLNRTLGRLYNNEERVLLSLDQFLADPSNRYQDLSSESFLEWCRREERLSAGVRRSHMRIVRNLCIYRRRTEPNCFVPDRLLFPAPHRPVTPYIFSESETARLLAACSHLPRVNSSPLRTEVIRLAVVLLYTTGLRRGELLRLTVGDYDSQQGTLLVRASKFHKSRLLPLHPDVIQEIEHYLQARRHRRLPVTPETLLIWNRIGRGRAYTGTGLQGSLAILLNQCSIRTPQGRLPRIHDWRHSLAVNALLRWYRQGADLEAKLPLLATYLGHVSIFSTHYYLHFVEPLRTLASRRFAHRYSGLVRPLGAVKGVRR